MSEESASKPVRFIFHIGAGKTGTSSIQQTLRENEEELRRQGVLYLGLMLEHAPHKIHPWQKASASEVFHALTPQEMDQQFMAVIRPTLAYARRHGIHTLIWSNESFFERTRKIRKALKRFEALGVELDIVAYVRRHDAWIRSAYVQWGIKHKTYAGRIKPFREWVEGRPPKFAAQLLDVEQAFPGRLMVRNLDAVKDAVADFLQCCRIDGASVVQSRVNETPAAEELLLRALYNDRHQGKVLPDKFNHAFSRGLRFDVPPGEYLAALLPSDADIDAVRDSAAEDIAALNALLASQGQEPVAMSRDGARRSEVRESVLLKALCQIVVEQSLRIEKLEKALEPKPES
jgi:hypothetical protein